MTTYDYIVVGAGSAGCAVAGRLATESSASVLLIEAGGSDRRLRIRAPLMASMQYGTSLDWAYETEPEPGCADRRITQPRGRVLGGCSAMNAMYWIKGSNLDYDGWRPGRTPWGKKPSHLGPYGRVPCHPPADPPDQTELPTSWARLIGDCDAQIAATPTRSPQQ